MYSGKGVASGFPAASLKRRNASVATTQTVWLPSSDGPVEQWPSRKKPVPMPVSRTSAHVVLKQGDPQLSGGGEAGGEPGDALIRV